LLASVGKPGARPALSRWSWVNSRIIPLGWGPQSFEALRCMLEDISTLQKPSFSEKRGLYPFPMILNMEGRQ
jgi:hypothetical protein